LSRKLQKTAQHQRFEPFLDYPLPGAGNFSRACNLLDDALKSLKG
jgi:hypothetical protein